MLILGYHVSCEIVQFVKSIAKGVMSVFFFVYLGIRKITELKNKIPPMGLVEVVNVLFRSHLQDPVSSFHCK